MPDLDQTIDEAMKPVAREGGMPYGDRPWRYDPEREPIDDIKKHAPWLVPWTIVDATGRVVCAVIADVEILNLIIDSVNGDFVSAADVGDVAGVDAGTMTKWVKRYQDPEDTKHIAFPAAHARTSTGAVWLRRQVMRWLVETRRLGKAA